MSEADKFRTLVSEKIKALDVKAEPTKKVEELFLPRLKNHVKLRLYWPNDTKISHPVMYIHGAAFVAGSIDTHDNICRYICNRSGRVVASVNYRLAPEHKFPAAFEDCLAAFDWLRGKGRKLNCDNTRVILVGDSAGGALIASLSNALRKAGRSKEIPLQILINPTVDLRPGSAFYKTCKSYIEMYLTDVRQESLDEYVSPLLATDFRKLPPSLIVTSEKDEIKNDGERYFRALSNAGVEVAIFEMPNVGHLGAHCAAAHPLAEKAMNITIGALQNIDHMTS